MTGKPPRTDALVRELLVHCRRPGWAGAGYRECGRSVEGVDSLSIYSQVVPGRGSAPERGRQRRHWEYVTCVTVNMPQKDKTRPRAVSQRDNCPGDTGHGGRVTDAVRRECGDGRMIR